VTAAIIARRGWRRASPNSKLVVIQGSNPISHENIRRTGLSGRLLGIVMTYPFMDVNQAEELTWKMPGEVGTRATRDLQA